MYICIRVLNAVGMRLRRAWVRWKALDEQILAVLVFLSGRKKKIIFLPAGALFFSEFGAETCAARSGMLHIGGVQSFRAGGSVFSEKIQGREVSCWSALNVPV